MACRPEGHGCEGLNGVGRFNPPVNIDLRENIPNRCVSRQPGLVAPEPATGPCARAAARTADRSTLSRPLP